MCDTHGLCLLTGASNNAFLEKYLQHNKALWARYEHGEISAADLKWKRMWRTLLDFKIADEALAKKLSDAFLDILPRQKKVFPHTTEILDYLQGKGYYLHLITNGFEQVQTQKLQSSGLQKYFYHLITSERSQSLKPKKEIFQFAFKVTGAQPQESLMLGDNLKADIKGAINAGIDSVFVNHIAEKIADIHPTYTISHLKELENIL